MACPVAFMIERVLRPTIRDDNGSATQKSESAHGISLNPSKLEGTSILINRDSEKWGGIRKEMPHTEVRYLDIQTETEFGVLNDYLFLVNYSEQPYGLLIKDKSFANTYKVFFNILWEQAKSDKD